MFTLPSSSYSGTASKRAHSRAISLPVALPSRPVSHRSSLPPTPCTPPGTPCTAPGTPTLPGTPTSSHTMPGTRHLATAVELHTRAMSLDTTLRDLDRDTHTGHDRFAALSERLERLESRLNTWSARVGALESECEVVARCVAHAGHKMARLQGESAGSIPSSSSCASSSSVSSSSSADVE